MRSSSAGISLRALEHVGVDDRDADEHDALEMPGEHPQQREQRVPAEAAVAADEQDGDRPARIQLAPLVRRAGTGRGSGRAAGAGIWRVEAGRARATTAR